MTRAERIELRKILETWRANATECKRVADQIDEDDFYVPAEHSPEGNSWLIGKAETYDECSDELAAFIGWN